MRARTLTILFFFLCAFSMAPWRVSAESHIISHYSGVAAPYKTLYGGPLNLSYSEFFTATGTISDLLVPVSSPFGQGGDTMVYAEIYAPGYSEHLDCQTPAKSVDDWGIPQAPFSPDAGDIPTIDFGPFSGTQCDITDPTLPTSNTLAVELCSGDYAQHNCNSNIGFPGTGGYFNFAAYAGGVPSTATASSVLFLPGTEASRLYMRDVDGSEHQLWEPSFHTDVPLLAMSAEGTSVNRVYTKDLINSMYGNKQDLEAVLARLFVPNDLEVYGQFEQFMAGLVSSHVISEWRAYPYDWRYDPFDIVANGTLTEMPDGSLQTVHVQDVLEEMASSSPTGKVTIVAHSNGGLLAKALASTMGADASKYIDRIIMVGTPQFGTPAVIGAMLHGDGETYGLGLIMSGADVRAISQEMPDAYDLLPSGNYLARVTGSVATFDTAGILSNRYAMAYGTDIGMGEESTLDDFLADSQKLDELVGSQSDTDTPLILSRSLLEKAASTHDRLDTWTSPDIAMSSIAGWGQSTVEGIAYADGDLPKLSCSRTGLFSLTLCDLMPSLVHSSLWTSDGDGRVIDASAFGNTMDDWYFDAAEFDKENGGTTDHQKLMSASSVQQAVRDYLEGAQPTSPLLSKTRPSGGFNPITFLQIVANSQLDVTDILGNETAVVSIPGTDFSLTKKHASGVSLSVSGDGTQTVTVPQTGTFKVTAGNTTSSTSAPHTPGTSSTSTPKKTKIKITKTRPDGTATTTASYEIPTTASTTVTITVTNGDTSAPVVDPGDGTPPYTIIPDTPATVDTPSTIEQLKAQLQALAVRPGVKNRLLRALQPIEAGADDLASVQSAVSNLETLIKAQSGVKLTLEQGASMLQLLDTLKL